MYNWVRPNKDNNKGFKQKVCKKKKIYFVNMLHSQPISINLIKKDHHTVLHYISFIRSVALFANDPGCRTAAY